MQGLIANFQIFPGEDIPEPYSIEPEPNRFYEVWIFEDESAMRRGATEISQQDYIQGESFGAMVLPSVRYRISKSGQTIFHTQIGDAVFHKGKLGSGLIAHECIHLATSYLRSFQRPVLALSDQIDDTEERLAYAASSCCRQLVDWLYELEIL